MKKRILSFSLVVVGFLLGATALSALAQTWSPPGTGYPTGTNCTPPNCNTPAPINVGSSWQYKMGPVSFGTNTELTTSIPALDVIGGALFDNLGITGNLIVASGSPQVGAVLTAQDTNGTAGWQMPGSQTPTECQGSGLVWVIPNSQMNDNGSSAANDSMEIYCRNGVARWCLSGEQCPWRSNIASDDSQVCSPSGLGTGSYYPGNPNMLLMTSAWGDLWQPYTVYYCSKDGTQKVGRYVSTIGNLSCGPDNTTQVINQPVVWSSLTSPTGGDSTNYTYQWNGTDHGSWLPSPSTSQNSITYSYTTPGTKTMSMNVLSYGASKSVSCTASVAVTLPPIQNLSCNPSSTNCDSWNKYDMVSLYRI